MRLKAHHVQMVYASDGATAAPIREMPHLGQSGRVRLTGARIGIPDRAYACEPRPTRAERKTDAYSALVAAASKHLVHIANGHNLVNAQLALESILAHAESVGYRGTLVVRMRKAVNKAKALRKLAAAKAALDGRC